MSNLVAHLAASGSSSDQLGRSVCTFCKASLSDWATDAYVGYYEPYATSHGALDSDKDFQEEVRNAARTLMEAVAGKRNGLLMEAGARLKEPRPK
jgi:hypothetical protein